MSFSEAFRANKNAIDTINSERKWRSSGHPCAPYREIESKKIIENLEKRWTILDKIKSFPKIVPEPIIEKRPIKMRKVQKIPLGEHSYAEKYPAVKELKHKKNLPILKIVTILSIIILGVYLYFNPNDWNKITKGASDILDNLNILIFGNKTKNTDYVSTTSTVTSTTLMKCCCLGFYCGVDCGWLTECIGTYKECPSDNCGEYPKYTKSSSEDEPIIYANDIDLLKLEIMIHELINEKRVENGLSALVLDSDLSKIARYHSDDMSTRNYFDHEDPDGNGPTERYEKFGYYCHIDLDDGYYIEGGSENIMLNYLGKYYYSDGTISDYNTLEEVAESTVEGWMESLGHMKNILTPYWTREGLGVAITDNQYEGTIYITENFC